MKYLLSACLVAVSACAQAPATDDASTSPAAVEQQAPQDIVINDDPMCERSVRLIVNPLVARPGVTLKIFSDHPLGYAPPLDVPDELLTHWRASPEGAATFSSDGTQVTVSETAPAGADLKLTALFCGKEEVSTTVPIVAWDEPVIVGYWKQASADCTQLTPPHDSVKELAFDADGSFSVTYQPFESYRDYWGKHRFDYKTNTLELSVTGGNATPGWSKRSGKARLENEKRLVLEDIYLGLAGDTQATCSYVFVK